MRLKTPGTWRTPHAQTGGKPTARPRCWRSGPMTACAPARPPPRLQPDNYPQAHHGRILRRAAAPPPAAAMMTPLCCLVRAAPPRGVARCRRYSTAMNSRDHQCRPCHPGALGRRLLIRRHVHKPNKQFQLLDALHVHDHDRALHPGLLNRCQQPCQANGCRVFPECFQVR
jgi:hypothetical protein